MSNAAHAHAYYLRNKEKVKARSRAYALAHPDRLKCYRRAKYRCRTALVRAQTDAWRAQNPEKVKLYGWRVNLKKKYGLNESQYTTLLRFQNGGCAICGGDSGNKRLAVDHEHTTGIVRGLLCANCNSMLGHAKDNRFTLIQASLYLCRVQEAHLQDGNHYSLSRDGFA